MAIWLASCRYAGAATKGSSVHSQKTVSSRRQRIWTSRYRLALSKQARRAPHQDADHHQVNEKGPQPGKIILPTMSLMPSTAAAANEPPIEPRPPTATTI